VVRREDVTRKGRLFVVDVVGLYFFREVVGWHLEDAYTCNFLIKKDMISEELALVGKVGPDILKLGVWDGIEAVR
jgi:hypothetical protein